MSGSKVKSVEAASKASYRVVEITTERENAERTLSILKHHGFNRETIFRALDKGPYLLAFGISKTLPRLYEDFNIALGLNQSQIVHILSHCPYLIAQYDRYRGRDVISTIRAFKEVGYTDELLLKDIIRFPSMLAATPDRIIGWMNLLSCFGVGNKNGATGFCSLMRRSPYMFYVDPPSITTLSYLKDGKVPATMKQTPPRPGDNGAAFVTEPVEVLNYLSELQLPDIDKVVRSCPDILLTSGTEMRDRVNFLYEVCTVEGKGGTPPSIAMDVKNGQSNKRVSSRNGNGSNQRDGDRDSHTSNRDMFSREKSTGRKPYASTPTIKPTLSSHSILMKISESYPGALAVPSKKLRLVVSTLKDAGLRQSDILKLVRNYPAVLDKQPAALKELVEFLRYYCGLRISDIVPFIIAKPGLIGADVQSMKPHISYLFKSLGATSNQLMSCPTYLTCHLFNYIIPRAEFLRSRGKDPLFKGLHFFVTSSPQDFARAAGFKKDTDVVSSPSPSPSPSP